MEIYNRKKQASGAAYEEKLAQIEERLGPKKLNQVLNGETSIKRFMTKQSDILKDIFDLSTLDEGLRFNLDHAEGIAEIAKMENSNDIMRALNNLIGMTQSRNYELGWRGYSTSRKNLLNKIEQGIDVDKSLKQLNDLTKSVYPETQGKDAYKIIKGKVTPTKNFQFMYEPEKAFRQYFTELSTKDVGAKALLEQAKPGSELVQFLTKDEKTYEKIANNLFDKIKQNENVSLEQLTSLRKTYKNQREEALQEFGRLFCRTNSATGGRINLAQAGSPNICSPEEMLSNMKKDKIIAQGTDDAAALAKGRLLKAGKSVGKVLGYVAAPVDIAIELAFAGPSLLRGDVQGAINATTFGMLGGGKTGMEQVGEKFGKDSTEYALYGIEESIKDKMVAMDGLQKLFSESEQLGLIPSEQGVMQKQIGLEPQQKALLKQFVNQFKTLGDLDKKATQNFETFYPLTIDKMQNTKALQNIADFSTSQQPLAGKLDPNTVEGFIKSGGGVFEKEMLPRFTLPQYEENIRKLQELRIADFPLYLQSQLAGYEESQIPSEEERQLMLQQRQETPLDFVVPYDQIRYKGYRYGGRIQLADGGRINFSNGGRLTFYVGGGADMGGVADSQGNVGSSFGGGNNDGPDDRSTAAKAANKAAEQKMNIINTLNRFRPDTFVNPYNFSVDLNKNIGPFGLNSFINTLGILGIDDPRTPEDESEQDDYGISAGFNTDLFGGTLGLGAGYSPTTGTNFGLNFSKQFNQGGRVGFADGPEDPGKRKTMKILAGLASLPILGRFFDVAQVAEKAAPVIQKTVEAGPAHFWNLVAKIKKLGSDVTEVLAYKNAKKITKYGDLELTEDINTGQKTIQRYKVLDDERGAADYYGQPLTEETYMSYKPSQKILLDESNPAGGVRKTIPEYEEGTALIRSDREYAGDVVEEISGVADDIFEEAGVPIPEKIRKK